MKEFLGGGSKVGEGEDGEQKSSMEMRGELSELFFSEAGWDFLRQNGDLSMDALEGMDEVGIKGLYERWKNPSGLEVKTVDSSGVEKPTERVLTDDLVLSVVKNTADEKVMAADAAERRLRGELEEAKGLGGIVSRLLKGQAFKEYYLKKYEKEAYEKNFDEKGRRGGELGLGDDEVALVDRVLREYDGTLKATGKMEALPEDHPASVKAKVAIEAYARGQMDKESFRDEIGRIEAMMYDSKDPSAAVGEVVLGDYERIVEAVKGRLAHDQGVENVMEGFKLLRAEAGTSLKSEAHRTAVDKITEFLEKKSGGIVPTVMIAAAVGFTAWAGGKALSSSAKAIGLGVVATAGMAGAREHNRVTTDRAQMQRDLELGREVGDTKYDKQMRETIYQMESAKDLTANLKDAIAGKDTDKLLEAMAQVGMLDAVGDRKGFEAPMISFSGEGTRRRERLDLDIALAEARVRYKQLKIESGESGDLEDVLNRGMAAAMESNDSLRSLEKGVNAKDVAFAKLRLKRTLGAAGKTVAMAGVMAAVPFVFQEVNAAFSPDSYGLADSALGLENNSDASMTQMAEWLGLKNPSAIERVLPSIGEVDGVLHPAQKAELQARGFKVIEQSDVIEGDEASEVVSMDAESYAREYGRPVTRDVWANNGTEFSDGNELGAHYTEGGIVTKMTGAGSKLPDGETVAFSDLAKNGEIKMYLSMTGDTQSTPIEVVGEWLPDGQVRFIPEPGSVAAQCFDSDGKVIAKYAEIAWNRGVDGMGREHIVPLATVVGEGMGGRMVSETVTTKLADEIVTKTIIEGFDRPMTSMVEAVPNIRPIPIPLGRSNLTNGPERVTEVLPVPDGVGGGEAGRANTPEIEGAERLAIGMNPEVSSAPEPGIEVAQVSETRPTGVGVSETSPATEVRGVETSGGFDERTELMRIFGGETGASIMTGGYDEMPQFWRDRIFEDWWKGLGDNARDVLSGRGVNTMTPKSLAVQEWLRRTGKMESGGEMPVVA